MIKAGLTSVSFRNLSVDEIIFITKKAGLTGIEWGGDIHVPHGNLKTAAEVYKKTKEQGLEVSSYGSYYRLGKSETDGLDFYSVLQTAKALNAPCIRVWAGTSDLENMSQKELSDIIKDAKKIALLAEQENIKIAFEYHANTLTSTNNSAYLFSKALDGESMFYWQPPNGKNKEYCVEGLEYLINSNLLSNIHVFSWTVENTKIIRHTLEYGKDLWSEYFKIIKSNKNYCGYALLEFIKDDSLEQFYKDAECLINLVK